VPYHPELVPSDWLVHALARGERRHELDGVLRTASDDALVSALGWSILYPLAVYHEGGGIIDELLVDPSIPERVRHRLSEVRAAVQSAKEDRALERASDLRVDLDGATQRSMPSSAPIDELADLVATSLSTAFDASRRREALRKLTRSDRATAVAIAHDLEGDAVLGREARVLMACPTEAELHARGRELGVPTVGGSDLRAVLMGFPHRWIRRRRDHHPNRHDTICAHLAALFTPALDGVVFEEIPPLPAEQDVELDEPAIPTGERLAGVYRLRAYFEGQQLEAWLEDGDRWIDEARTLGMINTLLEERLDARRLVTIDTEAESLLLAAVPSTTIRTLRQEQWL